ncbi:unnamed protein product, partial [Prorocentrum cordatum]
RLCCALQSQLEGSHGQRAERRRAAAAFAGVLGQVAAVWPPLRPRGRRGGAPTASGGGGGGGGGGAAAVGCFLLSTLHGASECRRAQLEFVGAAARHAPELELRSLPGGASKGQACFEARVAAGAGTSSSSALERLFDAMRSAGDGFRHVKRVSPFDALCDASLASVVELVRQRSADVFSAFPEPTTFAIQLQSGWLHGRGAGYPSRDECLAAIGAALPPGQKVSLKAPDVIVQVKGFAGRCGVCVRHASLRLDCPTSLEDVYMECSAGQAYYRRDVNCGPTPAEPAAPAALAPLLDSAIEMDAWCARLSQAAPRAGASGGEAAAEAHGCGLGGQPQAHAAAAERQVRALAELARSAGLLELSSVEFGAGKGTLTRALREAAGAREAVRVLVDRDRAKGGACRHTDDSRFTEDFALRLRIDIRNLWLPGLPELQGQRVVGVGKHVCGAATDFALRSLCAGGLTRDPPPAVVAPPETEAAGVLKDIPRAARKELARRVGAQAFAAMPLREQVRLLQGARPPRVAGALIALCCHHLCTCESYCNPEWLEEHAVTAEQFHLICRMSRWAVSRPGGPLAARRRAVGRACRGFLDAGRAAFLARHGLQAEVVEYCGAEATPENRALLATPGGGGAGAAGQGAPAHAAAAPS